MRALSLWEPHASAVALSLKPYETRGWSTDYRGPLVIHAAKHRFKYEDYDRVYYMEVARRLREAKFPMFAVDATYGRALCVVDLVDCVPTRELRGKIGQAEFWGDFRDVGDDGKPRFAFKLENVRKLWPRPQIVGRQRFFQVDDSLIRFG
ncbi:MAG TPA: hypothetical protein VFW94_24265 [Candidatus Acidoferrales bacterium]|nr:hypothetical protein [Candidatus Acidoferrales bacterium]